MLSKVIMKTSFVHICPAKATVIQKLFNRPVALYCHPVTNPKNSYQHKVVLFHQQQLQPIYSLVNNFQMFTAGFHKHALITKYVNLISDQHIPQIFTQNICRAHLHVTDWPIHTNENNAALLPTLQLAGVVRINSSFIHTEMPQVRPMITIHEETYTDSHPARRVRR